MLSTATNAAALNSTQHATTQQVLPSAVAATAPTGATGSDDETGGATGGDDETGVSATASTGTTGSSGTTGSTGATGATAETGSTGATGEQEPEKPKDYEEPPEDDPTDDVSDKGSLDGWIEKKTDAKPRGIVEDVVNNLDEMRYQTEVKEELDEIEKLKQEFQSLKRKIAKDM